MRRNIWTQYREILKPTKVNKEGFPSFKGDSKTDLVNVLLTGTTGNTFYVAAEKLVPEIVEAMKAVEDTEFMAKAIVYAREMGYSREMPIAATVVLSTKDLDLFRKVVHRVCLNPKDWQKFIDIARSGLIRKGLGRALKREIKKAIYNMHIYHAIKYPKAVEDMINIARPHEGLNFEVIEYIKKNETTTPEVGALKKLKSTDDPAEAAELIRKYRLPYEVVPGSVKKMTLEIWEALLYVAPHFNLIRNLRNFLLNDVFKKEENLEYAVRAITDRDAIRRSKLYPFRYYAAWNSLRPYSEDAAVRLRKALEKAIEISVENVPAIEDRVCIAPDVSGSMLSRVLGDKGSIFCINVVGVLTGILIKKCRRYPPVVLPFNDDINFELIERIMGKESIFRIAEEFYANGGTSLSAPIEYLLKERVEVDRIIALTDNEEWVGRRFVDALRDYINKVNPDVRVYLITLAPYRDYPTPMDLPNVRYIFGWSDKVLDFVTKDIEGMVEEIEKISLE